jgi:hypothetical protein
MRGKLIALLSSFSVLLGVAIPSAEATSICAVGNRAQVLWKGEWYPARVLQVSADGDRCYINYDGFSSSWDEWVGGDRIRVSYSVGASVSVLWKGSWYPAQILQAQSGRYYITYDGYGSSWNEWVGADRVRSR